MDLITIVLFMFGAIGFIVAVTGGEIFNFRTFDDLAGSALAVMMFCLMMATPFFVREMNKEIRYNNSTEKQLIKLVDGVETYKLTCNVTLYGNIPYTIGVFDDTAKVKPFNKSCLDLDEDDYDVIHAEMDEFRIMINELDE